MMSYNILFLSHQKNKNKIKSNYSCALNLFLITSDLNCNKITYNFQQTIKSLKVKNKCPIPQFYSVIYNNYFTTSMY